MKPNVPYHLARLEGKITRRLYHGALRFIAQRKINIPRSVPLEVYAYSGENNLPEQVASTRSFLANVGRPKQFTVVSDGVAAPGNTRTFSGFAPALAEVALARVYGGIHFLASCTTAQTMGRLLAEQAMATQMVPLHGSGNQEGDQG